MKLEATVSGVMRGLIDERHHGLFCRADATCGAVFPVAHDERPVAAAVKRDAHELTHGYVHIPRVEHKRNWNAGAVAMRGRPIH